MEKNSLIKTLEQEGYLIVRNALSKERVTALIEEMTRLEQQFEGREFADTEVYKASATRVMIHDIDTHELPATNELVADSACRALLNEMIGGQVLRWTATYANCKPGHPALSFHTDYDPYECSKYRPNHPSCLRVLYYLDDLNAEKSPLHIAPRSHTFLHKDYQSDIFSDTLDVDIVTPTIATGDMIIINPRVIHGTGENNSGSIRRVIAITYVPDWARPLTP
ncbi:phytanoyl-CoA dioxygenase family protein [Pseudomonas sp. R5-89-07]|uniref:phytanoyl-CoA dioxygenase family protein n=1 Tax=Pseudomonas sp. R5-89-07 TaxID=658644 RepID=UPI000F56E8DC|nr:phytanoyl-CoA dioxygenase family protein [Pseudomonas sp. R5-89-07]AZF07055.1 hypothetical protein C4J94_4314 [Pseudomonas sp. R5-89-07]